jgi:ABC-type branched-subunit amino acid transport system substrate-binding protein
MRRRFIAAVIALGLVAAACGNSKSTGGGDGTSGGTDPGISATEIRVGGVGAITNPLGGNYKDAFDGVEAYFDKVNKAGGVNGRTLKLVAKRDDNSAPSRNVNQVRALVEEDKVFAVLPVSTTSFAGADYLVQHKVPTFGWNINAEWAKGPNLFGEKGSYLCFTCANAWLPYAAKALGRTKVAVLAYTAPQSADCAKGWKNSFDTYGSQVGAADVYDDSSLSFGFSPGDIAPDIDAMRQKGVQMLVTCIDGAGSARLAQAVQEAGLDIVSYLPNGYDTDLISQNASTLEGGIVSVGFVPFEESNPPAGLQEFLDAMAAKGKTPNENSLSGWISADMFVTGLKAAGKNPTRASLIDAVNKLTDYTANGIEPTGIDWTIAHEKNSPEDCAALLKVAGGKLVPILGQPAKPFICFSHDNPDFSNPTYR